MKLTIRWRDGTWYGEATFDVARFEDGDLLDLTQLSGVEPGNYVGDLSTGEIAPAGRLN